MVIINYNLKICFSSVDLLKGEFYKVRIAAFTRYTTGDYTPWILVKLLGERNNAQGDAVNTSAIETVSREIYLSILLFIELITAEVNTFSLKLNRTNFIRDFAINNTIIISL